MQNGNGHLVVMVGAGPAALYATGKLAQKGHAVVILNRDIKPGGLAEYGSYLSKHKMKEGLRKQFRQILANPRVIYFGNVQVGQGGGRTSQRSAGSQTECDRRRGGCAGDKVVRRSRG